MTPRDRLVVAVLVAVAVIGAAYFLVVSPKQKQASDAAASLNVARSALGSAQQQLAQGRAAATSYERNLNTVRDDYRAVPTTDAVNELLPTLQRTSTQRQVDFRVINVTSTAAAPTAAPAAPAVPVTPATGGAPAAGAPVVASAPTFTPTAFQFTFNGGYRRFQLFLRDLDRFVVVRDNGTIRVRNRLLVINSVALKPQAPAHGYTQAAITASAYSEPAAPTTPGAG